MITSVNHSPFVWSPSFSNIVWDITSDKIASYDFKYVFDVYINGVFFTRILQRPNPTGNGIIDVGPFCAGYLDISKGLVEDPTYSDDWGIGTTLGGQVHCLVGEQYRLSGPTDTLLIYNGVSDAVGDPSYFLYPRVDGRLITGITDTTRVRFTAGYKSSMDNYLFEVNPILTDYPYSMSWSSSPNHLGLFLTKLPNTTGDSEKRTMELIRGDFASLSFWNYTDEAGEDRYVYAAKLNFYKPSYGTSPYEVIEMYNTLVDGGGPRANAGATLGSGLGPAYMIGQLAIGPADIEKNIAVIDPTCTHYTIQLYNIGNLGTQTLGFAISEEITIQFVEEDCWTNEHWRFSWLNSLGGRDWYNFTKVNTQNDTSTKINYSRTEPAWASTYTAGNIAPNRFGNVPARNTIETKYTAETDWVTEQDSEYLRGLFMSTHVLAYAPGSSIPQLVNITTTTYATQKYNRQKMFNYTLEFTAGQPINAQFL